MEPSTKNEDLKPVRVEPGSYLRGSGLLFALGGASWLVYCGLMLWSLTLVVATFDPSTPSASIAGAMQVLRPAILVASIATWILALGVLVMPKATVRVLHRNKTDSRTVVYGVSRDARWKGMVSATFLILFGALGVPAFLAVAAPTTESIATALNLWLVDAVILFIGAEVFLIFAKAVARDTSGHLEISGSWFSEYAIAMLLGLVFLPIAQLLRAPDASAYAGTLYNGLLTAALYAQLLVVPITGIIIWGRFAIQSSRLGAARSVTTPRPTVLSAKAEQLEAGPEAGSASPLRAEDSLPAGAPAVTPIPAVPVRPDAMLADASSADARVRLDEGWVLRLQSQIANLEETVRSQRDAISLLERRIEGVMSDETEGPPSPAPEPPMRTENELEGPPQRGSPPRRKTD